MRLDDSTEPGRRARALVDSGGRRLLGITGAPGSGKSTLAAAIVRELGSAAVCVPMDGFHLAQAELERLGRADRKGAPDTFDAAGFVALLRRLRGPSRDVVYAPAFDRHIEEPIAGAIAVAPEVGLVVVEGNYLLLTDGPWGQVADALDECWYLEADQQARIGRLISRHVEHGRTPGAARDWVLGSDERNADLVAGTRWRADLVVPVP
jgi:pantothenate kinase